MQRWMTLLMVLIIWAATPASAENRKLDVKTMLEGAAKGLLANSEFLPPAGAEAADAPFEGALKLKNLEMQTAPADFKSRQVMGKDPKLFPAAVLSFITVDDDLVPVSQEVLRFGSVPGDKSYWDLIVQPGKVWSETGDSGWNRASFPFALVHSLEGETHNGVAAFLYKEDKISKVHFQIVQMTAPFYVEDYFTAWGAIPAELDRTPIGNKPEIAETWQKDRQASLSLSTWKELESLVGQDKVENSTPMCGRRNRLSRLYITKVKSTCKPPILRPAPCPMPTGSVSASGRSPKHWAIL